MPEQAPDPAVAAATPGPKRHSAFWPMVADGIGNMADLGTTEMVLAQPNGAEANPLMSSKPGINALQKLASTAGEEYLIHKLNASGHPTAAKVMGFLLGGIGAGAAVHNVGVYRSLK